MKSLLSASVILLGAISSRAGISLTLGNQTGNGTTNFTPTFVVSSTDLINGKLPVSSAGTFTLDGAGGLPVLTNGVYGPIPPASSATHASFATVGGTAGAGTFVVYNLGANALGYSLSQISVYGGWSDSTRDEQRFTVSYATVGSAAFTNLYTVVYNPSNSSGQSATSVTLTENTLPYLVTGVDRVRFDFSPLAENGYVGVAEIDIIGVPTVVPEPGTVALGGLGIVALLARRRR